MSCWFLSEFLKIKRYRLFKQRMGFCKCIELDTQSSYHIFSFERTNYDNHNCSDLSSHWGPWWGSPNSCLQNSFHTSKDLDRPLLDYRWPTSDCPEPSFWDVIGCNSVLVLPYLEKISGFSYYVYLSCKTIWKSLSDLCNVDMVSQLDIPVRVEGDWSLLKYKFSVMHY